MHQIKFIRLKTGHCRIKFHLRRIGIINDDRCDECSVPETVEHFCDKHSSCRLPFSSAAESLGIPLSCVNLLTDPRLIELTLTYLDDTRMCV